MKAWCYVLLIGLASSGAVRAEQGCPAGLAPIGQAPGPICVPQPGYGLGAPSSSQPSQPQPRGPQWQSRFGAMSIDYTRGKLGTAANMANTRKAEKAAIAQCRANGGDDSSCKKNLLSWGNGCGVVAWGASFAAMRSGASVDAAASEALQVCGQNTGDCQIYYSGCSYPVQY
ncbi:DUF4189 domain-containing protein [Lysobacter sp. cf310]|uniref:DUF4189 domain-containing protein n=1 Tax=Lysobacter sp. cf310 TaxID=1761790 RepID=UPI0008EAFCC5|nr:DUF4189 domain-containing protein [Lysobacter sp. cf310]SFK97271.1 protein of unknown function [Lysobacter sp. cf310]